MKLNLPSAILLASLAASTAPAATLVALWDFSDAGNLGKATVGPNLAIEGAAPTHSASLADDGGLIQTGVITTVGGPANRLRVQNPIGPNGGGSFTNSYSLVFDLFTPEGSRGQWRALLQTSPTNSNDGDLFLRDSDDFLGVAEITYGPSGISSGDWTRIVMSYNLGTSITSYVNGSLFHEHSPGSLDGRFALDTEFLLFADEDDENFPLNVGLVALFEGALTEEEAAGLGRVGNPVPEPATGLLAGGMAVAALLRRRR